MDPTLAAIRDAIVKAVAPRKIVLFGSRARGDARPDSDYDLLLVVDPTATPTWRVGVAARLAARGFGVPIDLLVLTPEELAYECDLPWSVVMAAVKTGEWIHEAA